MTEGGLRTTQDWGRRAFSPKQRRVICAIVEALFCTEDDAGLVAARPALTARVSEEFDLMIGAGSADLGRGFRLFIFLIEWLPLFLLGTFSRASRLPLPRRLAYLDRLEHARWGLFATLLVAFKLPFTMLAFELDDELRATGFDRATTATRRILPRVEPVPRPAVPARTRVPGEVAEAGEEVESS